MYSCPRCTFRMEQVHHNGVELDHCFRCGGTYLDAGEAKMAFGEALEPSYWKNLAASRELGPSGVIDPKSNKNMTAYSVGWGGSSVEVEVCPETAGMWMDGHEIKNLQKIAKQAGSKFQIKKVAPAEGDEKEKEGDKGEDPGILAYIFQLLTSFPIEVWNPVRRRPLFVWTLVATLALIFLGQTLYAWQTTGSFFGLRASFMAFGLIPNDLFQGNNVYTAITHAFLHGSFLHLFGNLYFLYTFGDNVEDFMGRGRFIVMYILAALAGAGLHAISDTTSMIPMIGASGAIAGVMGAYLVLYPRVKVWIVFMFVRFKLGVVWYLVFWIGLQVYSVIMQKPGVAWLAHIGGFVMGALFALIFNKQVSHVPKYVQLPNKQSAD